MREGGGKGGASLERHTPARGKGLQAGEPLGLAPSWAATCRLRRSYHTEEERETVQPQWHLRARVYSAW